MKSSRSPSSAVCVCVNVPSSLSYLIANMSNFGSWCEDALYNVANSIVSISFVFQPGWCRFVCSGAPPHHPTPSLWFNSQTSSSKVQRKPDQLHILRRRLTWIEAGVHQPGKSLSLLASNHQRGIYYLLLFCQTINDVNYHPLAYLVCANSTRLKLF